MSMRSSSREPTRSSPSNSWPRTRRGAWRGAVERGTKVVVIDPRRTETARRAHVHLQARPGQDAVVMAGLLHVILREDLVDHDFIRAARQWGRVAARGRRAVHSGVRRPASRHLDRRPGRGGPNAWHRAPRRRRWRHRHQHDELHQRDVLSAAGPDVGARVVGPRGRSDRAAQRSHAAQPREGASAPALSGVGIRAQDARARARTDQRRTADRGARRRDPASR